MKRTITRLSGLAAILIAMTATSINAHYVRIDVKGMGEWTLTHAPYNMTFSAPWKGTWTLAAGGTNSQAVGAKVYLSTWIDSGVPTAYAWKLVSTPPGSKATLDASTGQLISFSTDDSGAYALSVTVTTGFGSFTAVDTIWAGYYNGVGTITQYNFNKGTPGGTQCGYCHAYGVGQSVA